MKKKAIAFFDPLIRKLGAHLHAPWSQYKQRNTVISRSISTCFSTRDRVWGLCPSNGRFSTDSERGGAGQRVGYNKNRPAGFTQQNHPESQTRTLR